MRLLRFCVPILALVPGCFAQLTPDQKTSDFMQLVGLYAKNYAPYELRRDLFGFDLYNISPWLAQISASTDDLTYYDILTRYVASLQDSHDEFILPSDFEAWLHMDLDIYDGKVLIGFIDTVYLPPNKYPLEVGDEIVSVDGVQAADLVKSFIPYAFNGSGNPTSQARIAAATITDRLQAVFPKAAQIGATATVVVNRLSGASETLTIPWDKTGTPIVTVGPVPSPHAAVSSSTRARSAPSARRPTPPRLGNPGIYDGPPANIPPDPVPAYMQAMRQVTYGRAFMPFQPLSLGIAPFDNPSPRFALPAGFKLRLGNKSTDNFVSGTYTSSGHTIGYIRIYTMAPASESTALTQFVTEVLFFQQNTDGLVVDVMGNGGGFGCYTQTLASTLIPHPFRGLIANLRATQEWVESFSIALYDAKTAGAAQWIIDLYTQYLTFVQQALSQSRGDTGPLPLCTAGFNQNPLMDTAGNIFSYNKPILVLTDSFTLSAAEIFAMYMQDSQRAPLFGTRTDGGGGNVVEFNATNYSEGFSRVTESLITRAQPVATPGFPMSQYSIFYDGMGIYPDIVEDYQTLDNLQHNGATFVKDFTAAIVNLINGGH